MNLDEARAVQEQSMLLLDCSDDEIEAFNHAAEQVRVNGRHSLTCCPYPCRAMCAWRTQIRAMIDRGIEVPE